MRIRAKLRPPNNPKKIQDNLGNVYNSIKSASIETGLKRTTINAVVTGQNKKTRDGRIFFYVSEDK